MDEQLPKNRQFRKIFTIKMPLCLAEIMLPTHCFGIEKLFGHGSENIILEIENGNIIAYFNAYDIDQVGSAGLHKLEDKNFVEKMKVDSFVVANNLLKNSIYIEAVNSANYSNLDLLEQYQKQIKLIRQVYMYFHLSSPIVSLALEQEIEQRLLGMGFSRDEIMEIKESYLSDPPKSTPEKEEEELNRLAVILKTSKEVEKLFLESSHQEIIFQLVGQFPEYYNLLLLHIEKYKFLQGYVDFHEFDKVYFIYRLKEIIEKGVTESVIEKSDKKLNKFNKELSHEVIYLLEVSKYFSFHRMEMRIYYTKGLVAFRRLIDEVARRINIGVDDGRQLLISEVNEFLKEEKFPDMEKIKKRKDYCLLIIEERNFKLLTGEKAKKYSEKYLIKNSLEGVVELKGKVASPGKFTGIAKVLFDEKDLIKQMADMKPGTILITGNTRPDMMVACNKAAAIVTEEGGILSHAALVSRELGIPCVINVKEATKVFKDGDMVEVDAVNGVVKKV